MDFFCPKKSQILSKPPTQVFLIQYPLNPQNSVDTLWKPLIQPISSRSSHTSWELGNVEREAGSPEEIEGATSPSFNSTWALTSCGLWVASPSSRTELVLPSIPPQLTFTPKTSCRLRWWRRQPITAPWGLGGKLPGEAKTVLGLEIRWQEDWLEGSQRNHSRASTYSIWGHLGPPTLCGFDLPPGLKLEADIRVQESLISHSLFSGCKGPIIWRENARIESNCETRKIQQILMHNLSLDCDSILGQSSEKCRRNRQGS